MCEIDADTMFKMQSQILFDEIDNTEFLTRLSRLIYQENE
jgi:hypothetical protein